ncbi:exodeoxyribonuclease VII large subunit [Candidatus Saccharibacteria bacterium]|nr:exodeoxyribonuclease VII large subunit [Candidatus Saccharibacteria bacterium]MCA9328491.1 exodeoxyribonuclease VII large subunit [Candidatus Saccharibacteria bacterium]
MTQPIFDVSTAIAVLNQTLEFAYPTITVVGELSQFQVSKGKWVYFDLKDEQSKLRCFGSVWQLKTALEDGMQVEVVAQPRLHNLYGFSLNIQAIRPVGEGSIRKAADLLRKKLEKEGLFAPERKRALPYPPERIALIASGQSAAYADFLKILQARWPYLEIDHYEVQVQGASAEEELVTAIQQANSDAGCNVLVMIRGGGSADDLAAFSTETVTRAIAMSRIPTMVAIGHEVDIALSELAADVRASTPSNAAELLVPDREAVRVSVATSKSFLNKVVADELASRKQQLNQARIDLKGFVDVFIQEKKTHLEHARLRLESYHPKQVMKRGYGLVRRGGRLVKITDTFTPGDTIDVELLHNTLTSEVKKVSKK